MGACVSLVLLFASIPAVVVMLFFVKATPYVVSATTAILFLLLIKFVEYRVRLDGNAHS